MRCGNHVINNHVKKDNSLNVEMGVCNNDIELDLLFDVCNQNWM